MSNDEIYKIKKENIVALFNHYIVVIEYSNIHEYEADALITLCNTAIKDYDAMYNLDDDNSKVNRWLGYVQGTLIAKGITDIQKERDFTRPYLTKHRELIFN